MKQLVCEMCGSNDLIKQDSVFICQHCGTKYSVEEAKKMLVEGTVKIDNTDKTKNLYQIARRARTENNIEIAAKYYDMIQQEEPNSWEAVFYSVYYKAASCKIAEISFAATSISNCIPNVFILISVNNADETGKLAAYKEVARSVLNIANLFYLAAAEAHGSSKRMLLSNSDPNAQFYRNTMENFCQHVSSCASMLSRLASHLETRYVSGDCANHECIELAVQAWKRANQLSFDMYKELDYRWQAHLFNSAKEMGSVFDDSIKKYDSSYINPFSEKSPPVASKRGCYIATAIYGSYDCPQVWTLRRYRDYTLAETWYGRVFIHIYYTLSPTLVKWLGHTEWFKMICKGKLDHMVRKLNADGVSNTPYEDRKW